MKTITQYREDTQALMERSAALDAKATQENRDLTEAELALKNQLLDTVERIQVTVQTLERQERAHAALTIPEGETRAAARTVTPGIEVGDDLRTKDRFNSLGEQLAAIRNADVRGGHVDPRLFNAISTGLSETVPSDGGYLIQTDFSTRLLEQAMEVARLPGLCQEVPISSSANKVTINGEDETSRATGSRGGGIRGYWIGEGTEITQSKPKYRKVELSLRKLAGLCDVTDEMLSDSATLAARVENGFRNEFGFLLDDAIINGSGDSQPLGILNAGCLVAQAKEDGQSADTIVVENVVKMASRLFARSMANAYWLVNQTVLPQLWTMSMPIGVGGVPVYLPPGGLSSAPYGMLWGRPVMAIEQCQALGDQGDIILADFGGGYLLATKGGLKSDVSIHARFEFDEQVFRFILRVDGQPVRASALTPFKGGSTATQSHFVTLAARA